MNTQAKELEKELEANGWTIVQKENPESTSYWWVWEFWTIKKNSNNIVLNFLIDPQCEKKKEHVWAVTATKQEPNDRLEAEKGILLALGRKWENRLPEFIEQIGQTNWL